MLISMLIKNYNFSCSIKTIEDLTMRAVMILSFTLQIEKYFHIFNSIQLFNTESTSLKMSIRQLLKTFRSGLFYFPRDKTLMVLPTKYIVNEIFEVGMEVQVSLGKKKESGEIILLGGK